MRRQLSLRTRLLLAVGAVALVALVVADFVTYSSLRSFLYDRVDQSLESAHFALKRALEGRGPPGETTVASVAPGTYVEVRAGDGRVIGVSGGTRRDDRALTPRLPAQITGFNYPGPGSGAGGAGGEPRRYLTVGPAQPGGPTFRVRAAILANGEQVILAVPLDDTQATLGRLLNIELAVTATALLVAVALGWWLVRVGLRPLADVETTAGAIADGDFDRRVPGDDASTEVGQLARALNTMLERIQAAFRDRDATEAELRRSEARLRRFVADASHELRTPVAAVAAYAELFERGASDRPVDLARVMSGIRVETSRMGELVDDLLLLARLDEGRPLEQEPVELVAVAAQAVDAAVAVGPGWPVRLEAGRPVEVSGDAARLRQVLDNLLGNVRAHTPEGTSVVVRMSDEADGALIQVIDDGPGMTQDEAAHVFERFYRVDKSRSRQHGGAGLGLAIVAAIVQAHGGEVAAKSAPGAGATFTVRLPLAQAVEDEGSSPFARPAGEG
ncbi:MAG: HAMP domain-containing histidine kinase [Actinomycetota bacterium]|nr:HAMP domain-containing histidine kinase [Actinomycetota bacterium]